MLSPLDQTWPRLPRTPGREKVGKAAWDLVLDDIVAKDFEDHAIKMSPIVQGEIKYKLETMKIYVTILSCVKVRQELNYFNFCFS